MQSKAQTASEYMKQLPKDRKGQMETIRKLIKKNIPKECKEGIQWGMLAYSVPLKIYPAGYGEDKTVPLPYVALASQKNYMAIYLMNTYGDQKIKSWFLGAYKDSGKKLDMGKSCIRFKKVDDLALDVIAEVLRKVSLKEFIAMYEKGRKKLKKR